MQQICKLTNYPPAAIVICWWCVCVFVPGDFGNLPVTFAETVGFGGFSTLLLAVAEDGEADATNTFRVSNTSSSPL